MDTSQLLDVDALAARWGVSPATIFNRKRTNQLPEPARLPGRSLRWTKRAIEIWEEKMGLVIDTTAWTRQLELIEFAADLLRDIATKKLQGGKLDPCAKRLAILGRAFLVDTKAPVPARHTIAIRLLNLRWERTLGELPEKERKEVEAVADELAGFLRDLGGAK